MPYTGGTSAQYGVTGGTGTNIIFGATAIGDKVNGSTALCWA